MARTSSSRPALCESPTSTSAAIMPIPMLLTAGKVSFRLFRCLPGATRRWDACSPRPRTSPARSTKWCSPTARGKAQFASDPNIVGKTLTLNQQPYRVIGVMGPEFNWPNQAELWMPLALPLGPLSRSEVPLQRKYGRLARASSRRHAGEGKCLSRHEDAAEHPVGGQQELRPRRRAGECSACR